jgi:hypothetical protein
MTDRLPTEAEILAVYRDAKARFDLAYRAWIDGGKQGDPPPRPVPPHIPGFGPQGER